MSMHKPNSLPQQSEIKVFVRVRPANSKEKEPPIVSFPEQERTRTLTLHKSLFRAYSEN
jgi:hypothetical protein